MAWNIHDVKKILNFYEKKSHGIFRSGAVKAEYAKKAKELSVLIDELEVLSPKYQKIALSHFAITLARMESESRGSNTRVSVKEIKQLQKILKAYKQKW